MEVYLIRHGIAAARGTYANDKDRPLVAKGIQRATKVANRLATQGVEFDLILTSPLKRAVQTANILQQEKLAKNSPKSIVRFTALKPGGEIGHWLEWLSQWRVDSPHKSNNRQAKLALVGHQPDLGNWAEMLLWGTVKGQIVVKKAGIIGIKLPNLGTPVARSSLFLLASPKWIIND